MCVIGNNKEQFLTGSVAFKRQRVAPVTCGTVQVAVASANEVRLVRIMTGDSLVDTSSDLC